MSFKSPNMEYREAGAIGYALTLLNYTHVLVKKILIGESN